MVLLRLIMIDCWINHYLVVGEKIFIVAGRLKHKIQATPHFVLCYTFAILTFSCEPTVDAQDDKVEIVVGEATDTWRPPSSPRYVTDLLDGTTERHWKHPIG